MKRIVAAGLLVILLGTAAVVWYRTRPADDHRLADARAKIGTRAAGPLLDQLARDDPDHAEVQFLAARQARLEGRTDGAATRLGRAAALGWSAGQIEREQILGRAAIDVRSVRPALDQLLAANPDDRDVLLALAEGELRGGRLAAARELAGRVLELAPTDPAALWIRGTSFHRARRIDLARADLEAVVAAGPDTLVFNRARLELATCLLDLGEFPIALDFFRAGSAAEPDNPLALFGVGRAASYLGRLDEAAAAFQAVLALRPGHVETLLALAQLSEQRGDSPGALGYLEDAEKRDPDRLETHWRLAKVLAVVGRDQEAAAHEHRFRELTARQLPAPGAPAPAESGGKPEERR